MTTVSDLVRRGIIHKYVRVSMKRPILGGGYESDWIDISKHFVSIGAITRGYTDTVLLNLHTTEFTQITLLNMSREFNPENDPESIFYGYLTRYRTKFRVELIGIDYDDSEVVMFRWFGVNFGSPISSDNGTIAFDVSSPLKALENYPAYGVDITATTSAGMVDRLVKMTANGARIFDQFFEGATDSDRYQINTNGDAVTTIPHPSVTEQDTVAKKLFDYCVIDDFFATVDQSGNFVFKAKSRITDTVQWVFNGIGEIDNSYGVNIASIDTDATGVENTFTRASVEYQDNTYAVYSRGWTPGDNSFADIYGVRTFSVKLIDLDYSSALSVAQNIVGNYQSPKRIITITTPIIPHLNLNDLIEINYFGEIAHENPFILGVSRLDGTDVLSHRIGSVNLVGFTGNIISIVIDINECITTFTVREL